MSVFLLLVAAALLSACGPDDSPSPPLVDAPDIVADALEVTLELRVALEALENLTRSSFNYL